SINVSNLNATVGNFGAGTLSTQGGTMRIAFGNLFVGRFTNSTGTVWVNGGASILLTNVSSTVVLGTQGSGQLTLSNGTVQAYAVAIGVVAPGRGTLT